MPICSGHRKCRALITLPLILGCLISCGGESTPRSVDKPATLQALLHIDPTSYQAARIDDVKHLEMLRTTLASFRCGGGCFEYFDTSGVKTKETSAVVEDHGNGVLTLKATWLPNPKDLATPQPLSKADGLYSVGFSGVILAVNSSTVRVVGKLVKFDEPIVAGQPPVCESKGEFVLERKTRKGYVCRDFGVCEMWDLKPAGRMTNKRCFGGSSFSFWDNRRRPQ